MSAAASSTSRLANSPASGGGFDRPQVAITIGLEWRLPPARATTTSMGRLTLNILLSFAQFEREVIGERIRDKFAASRARGQARQAD